MREPECPQGRTVPGRGRRHQGLRGHWYEWRGDGSHLFGRGAVGEHVTTRHQGEFSGSKQSVTDDELVGRPGPGCRRGPFGVDPGPAGRNEHDVTLAGGDQSGRVEHRGNSRESSVVGCRSETQLRAICAQSGPTTPSTSCGRCQHRRVHPGAPAARSSVSRGPEPARLHGVADTGDGDVTERVWMARCGRVFDYSTVKPSLPWRTRTGSAPGRAVPPCFPRSASS